MGVTLSKQWVKETDPFRRQLWSEIYQTLNEVVGNQGEIALPKASTADFGVVKVGPNLTITTGLLSLTKANVVSALGYTPINDKNYVHYQGVAADTWNVIHNLGKYPSVQVVDSGGNAVWADVGYLTVNELTITFSVPTSGKAYVN